MKPAVGSHLKVTYDKETDILWMRIPGQEIQVSREVAAPLVIDFDSENEGCGVVGVELHRASEYLAPMLESLKAEVG